MAERDDVEGGSSFLEVDDSEVQPGSDLTDPRDSIDMLLDEYDDPTRLAVAGRPGTMDSLDRMLAGVEPPSAPPPARRHHGSSPLPRFPTSDESTDIDVVPPASAPVPPSVPPPRVTTRPPPASARPAPASVRPRNKSWRPSPPPARPDDTQTATRPEAFLVESLSEPTPRSERYDTPPPPMPPMPPATSELPVFEQRSSFPSERPSRRSSLPPAAVPRRRSALAPVVALLIGGAAGAGGHYAYGEYRAGESVVLSRSAAAPPAASASNPSGASSSSAPPRAPTLLDRAREGHPDALRQLDARQNLTEDEALALARGREAKRRAELETLQKRLKGKPTDLGDREVIKALKGFVADSRTALPALEMVAKIPDPRGPDFLYWVWTAQPKRNDTTRLAEALVRSPTVRKRASPALAVVLALRDAADCKARLALMPKLEEAGDQRSFVPLLKLKRRGGCGPTKMADCNPCLRKTSALGATISAVRKRRAPRF